MKANRLAKDKYGSIGDTIAIVILVVVCLFVTLMLFNPIENFRKDESEENEIEGVEKPTPEPIPPVSIPVEQQKDTNVVELPEPIAMPNFGEAMNLIVSFIRNPITTLFGIGSQLQYPQNDMLMKYIYTHDDMRLVNRDESIEYRAKLSSEESEIRKYEVVLYSRGFPPRPDPESATLTDDVIEWMNTTISFNENIVISSKNYEGKLTYTGDGKVRTFTLEMREKGG